MRMLATLITLVGVHSFLKGPAVANNPNLDTLNPNLNTLLFYTCVTPQVGNQCEEGFTLDQQGIITRGVSSNFTTIEAGRAANISTLFAVHDTFFENGAGLRKDWTQAWAALQTKLEPLIRSKVVVGFFVGDELFPGKISLQDFKTALQAMQVMKKEYPWLITWENEGGTTWVNSFKKELGGVPEELDIISCDDYYMWENNSDTPQSQADGHRAFYEREIYPLLKPHQKVYLVPGSFGTRDTSGPYPSPYSRGNKTYCYDGTFDVSVLPTLHHFCLFASCIPLACSIHMHTRSTGM
jgi:hypothetical protein